MSCQTRQRQWRSSWLHVLAAASIMCGRYVLKTYAHKAYAGTLVAVLNLWCVDSTHFCLDSSVTWLVDLLPCYRWLSVVQA